MCLATPGRVVRVLEPGPPARVAEVDFSGVLKVVNLVYVPEAAVGDYVIVHAGFATTRMEEREALEALEYTRQMNAMADAPVPIPTGPDHR
ncbi:MAG: HypC/HybG/HupF family hydrogenase formation chaperone [Thermoplasmata archaeon]|nr:HypC/HybG/HupF family hydrogenase formation chaperone [Thermoplasmata archaeon]